MRDEDAQKLITRWKSECIYIYSTPSIPTTETTHGISEENVCEEDFEETQKNEAQSGEEAREEKSEKATREEAR
jgi:hypothetical protein